ncbi:MAG: hypothetical protein FWG02_00225 [Holophagaceae bacterium]|nr:hypothetical protein [Holophagaceae bacterium]
MTFFDGFLYGALLVAIMWAGYALVYIWFRTRNFGKRELFSAPAGSQVGGAIYAFTWAMLPWAKESIRGNLISYAMGIAYHVGIFTAIALLVIYIFPALHDLTAIFLYYIIPFALAFGVIGGISLLIKRMLNPILRAISSPDDYFSNTSATLFVGLALATLLLSRIWITRLWFISAIVLFIYIPFSKIRHCLFFFITRYHFGAFFGRRGCMPPSKTKV